MKKQTAIEWLVAEIKSQLIAQVPELDLHSLEQQAKAMEKEQIEDAWDDGIDSFSTRSAEQYYNETYGGDNV